MDRSNRITGFTETRASILRAEGVLLPTAPETMV